MANTLYGLAEELKLSIYGQLEDLDDALHLSHTCRRFHGQQRTIHKEVIISSHVYRFDLYLSRILKLNAASARLYRHPGNVLPNEHWPKVTEGLACMTTRVDKKGLNDADIWEIIIRWRKSSFLCELYTDGELFKEFEELRQSWLFESKLSPGTWTPLMEPGQPQGGINITNLKQNRFFDPSLKGRFHKGIVLHSMAVGYIQFARRATDLPLGSAESGSDAENFEDLVLNLWAKRAFQLGDQYNGQMVELLVGSKIACLEIFDFLYVFLLPKILPLEALPSWVGNHTGEYPYNDGGANQRFGIQEWEAFMDLSRWVLQPHDLVELIEKHAWTGTFPADKSMYMQTRAMFERGESKDDCRWLCDRKTMVWGLRDCPGIMLKEEKDPYWWDHIRVRCGSIFLAGSESKYQVELEKLKEVEGLVFGEGPMAAADASRASLPIILR